MLSHSREATVRPRRRGEAASHYIKSRLRSLIRPLLAMVALPMGRVDLLYHTENESSLFPFTSLWQILDIPYCHVVELVKTRTKAYEADPTEDIRFTILPLAPLMMNTEYLSQYAFIELRLK